MVFRLLLALLILDIAAAAGLLFVNENYKFESWYRQYQGTLDKAFGAVVGGLIAIVACLLIGLVVVAG